MKIGIAVTCLYCDRRKKPIGRSSPLELANGLCDSDCPGYGKPPFAGRLWPGETEEEFGFRVGNDGVFDPKDPNREARVKAITEVHEICAKAIVIRPADPFHHEIILTLQQKLLEVVNKAYGYKGPRLVMEADGTIHERNHGTQEGPTNPKS